MKTLLALTTTRCGKCPEISKYLREKVSGYDITIMDETHKYFAKNCDYWKASSAPCVILIEDGKEVGRAGDLGELKEILKC